MEAAGAVCLPAAGYRNGNNGSTYVDAAGSHGYYWSASSNDNYDAFDLHFNSSHVYPDLLDYRNRACAVRLVTESNQ